MFEFDWPHLCFALIEPIPMPSFFTPSCTARCNPFVYAYTSSFARANSEASLCGTMRQHSLLLSLQLSLPIIIIRIIAITIIIPHYYNYMLLNIDCHYYYCRYSYSHLYYYYNPHYYNLCNSPSRTST